MMLDFTLTHMFIHLHLSNNVCVKQKKIYSKLSNKIYTFFSFCLFLYNIIREILCRCFELNPIIINQEYSCVKSLKLRSLLQTRFLEWWRHTIALFYRWTFLCLLLIMYANYIEHNFWLLSSGFSIFSITIQRKAPLL